MKTVQQLLQYKDYNM